MRISLIGSGMRRSSLSLMTGLIIFILDIGSGKDSVMDSVMDSSSESLSESVLII